MLKTVQKLLGSKQKMEHPPVLNDDQSCPEHGILEASNFAKGDKVTMEPKGKLPVSLHCPLSLNIVKAWLTNRCV